MNSEAKQFLLRILNTPSPSGFESEGQKVWMSYVGRFADSVENDAYGTAWATLNGRDPAIRLMLEAHADEIGFMIQNITDEGILFLNRIGGSDRALARGIFDSRDRGPDVLAFILLRHADVDDLAAGNSMRDELRVALLALFD